ncbi:MAG: RsmE family RNA methyltransferase [candidate division Zixibacteria bacterium]|nr:RsmE family RNA methyltransferase [candidate division Zixibacteria bacterium]
MNLVILTEADLCADNLYRLTDSRAEHIHRILKLKAGDKLSAGLVNGPSATAEIRQVDRTAVELYCDFKNSRPVNLQKPEIDIICALPRPQTLKKVLQTSASMAVRKLYLIRANRVEKSYFDSPLLEKQNYTRFLIEGLSQGGFTRLPEVSIHHRFRPFFEDLLPEIESAQKDNPLCLCPHPEVPKQLCDSLKPLPSRVIASIGPEGGWVPFELELMQTQGFQLIRMGPWILRVENALVAVIAQVFTASGRNM